jgi:predicted aspartyl protease
VSDVVRKRATGTFYVKCIVENTLDRSRSVEVSKLLVDTGSESTWVSAAVLDQLGITREKTIAFVLANGREISRSVGFAILRIDTFVTVDEIVFAEPGDLLLLGARTLEGLNLTADAARKRLVPGPPHPAAVSSR